MKFLFHLFTLLVLMSAYQDSYAQIQVRARLDKEKILIGEPLILSLEVYVPLGTDLKWFKTDSIEKFEFLSRGKIDTVQSIESTKLTQQLIITSYDSGRISIPPFSISINRNIYYSDSVAVDVEYLNIPAGSDYRDIKTIIDIPHPYAKYIPWIIGLVTILSIALLIIILRRKRIVIEKQPVIEKVSLTPFQEAMEKLAKLKTNVEGPDDIKRYYTSLNDILRNYLSGAMKISVRDKTNTEIMRQIRGTSLNEEVNIRLSEALMVSDFVKFARYMPRQEDNSRNFVIIRDAVESINKTIQ